MGLQIPMSGKDKEISEYMIKNDFKISSKTSHDMICMEVEGVDYYLHQLETLAQGYTSGEMRFFVTALTMYAETMWKVSEKVCGKGLINFYKIISDILKVETSVATINKTELEKQRGADSE